MSIFKEININNIDIISLTDGLDILKLYFLRENSNNPIICIITDEEMEYLNGTEATKIIRNYELKNNKIKTMIFGLSCYEDIDFKNKILNSGADAVLPKPLNKNNLKSIFGKFKIL